MTTADMYCHPIDVSMAVAGEFDVQDTFGELCKRGAIAQEIIQQSGVIKAALYELYGDTLLDKDLWKGNPFAHPKNECDIILNLATLNDSVGMQEIRIVFSDATDFTVRGSVDGAIGSGDVNTNFDTGGVEFLSANWEGTAVADAIIYITSYTVDPVIMFLCSKLTAVELIDNLVRTRSVDTKPYLILEAHKRYKQYLKDLADGTTSLSNFSRQVAGFLNFENRWQLDELGQDVTDYAEDN